MKLILICAMAANRGIGYRNALPWHLGADLRRFRALTSGHTVLMGRKTYESIGRPLPKRRNIVLSRDPAWPVPEGVESAISLAAALELCAAEEQVYVIGGAQIYEQALPLAGRLELTLLRETIVADAFFPEIDGAQWRETAREDRKADADNDYDYSFVSFERVGGG